MYLPMHEDDGGCASPQQLQVVRTNITAATAILPVTPEMAWAVPRLLKRIHPVSPEVTSTSGVLRALVRMPALDEQFTTALAESGFLSCDEAIAQSRWRYELDGMLDKERSGSAAQVFAHCQEVLRRHHTNTPVDWPCVLAQLRTLRFWFPELRTIELLEQLYTRLHALHTKAVAVAQLWLDRQPAGSGTYATGAAGRVQAAEAPGASSRAGIGAPGPPMMEDGNQGPGGLRILVADDNHDAAAMLALVLELDGHRTCIAHNGADAVREASRRRFDTVLLDLAMPIMDGFDAAGRIGRLRPAPLLIACSAWDDAGTRRRTSEAGFSVHLVKPVRFEVLRAVLKLVRPAAGHGGDSR
jgi:CheY-like chemotaxis protein